MDDIPRFGRLRVPTRADLDPAEQAVYDAIVTGPRAARGIPPTLADADGRLQGPFNAMVQASPGIGMALQALGAEIRYGAALDTPLRELAIVTIAATRRSEFMWLIHAPAAAAAGVSDDILEGLARGEVDFVAAATDLAPAVVHRTVTELLTKRDLTADTHDKAVTLLGERGVLDLVILVGYYDTLALLMRSVRAPLPGDADPAW